MNTESRNCQNCKNDFTIEPDDFSFYEKIKVPPPTFCPDCRMIRRMVWRNVRSLYKRECNICKKNLISMYKDDGVSVLCATCFNGSDWDQYATGQDYDFEKPFFEQLKELLKKAPRFFAYHTGMLVNSDFTNYSADNKNAYLSYSVIGCEDVMYSESIDKSKNSMDCYVVQKLDGCFANIDCEGNYNSHFMLLSQNCIDSYFLYDCMNCQNCFLSSNLRNKQYYFKNVKLSKEEYQKAISNLEIEKYSGLQNVKKLFDEMIVNQSITRYAQIYNTQNATGDHIRNSRNIYLGFDVNDSENIKYSSRVLMNTKDSYDLQGLAAGELIYESVAASFGTFRDYFCYITLGSKDCEYSLILKNCSDCFGCVGLINAKYCIFNKQYSKEEYFDLVEKIKKHMSVLPYVDAKGKVYKYGEFFPFELSPFSYNETIALDNFPIVKSIAEEKGYPWKDREKRDYKTTIDSNDLPDNIDEAGDDILNEIIACPNNGNPDFQCTTAFRIVADELQFYRLKHLPLPRFCPNCRHYDRLNYRNTMKLYERACSNGCGNTFETTYAPDRPERVYCESCYQKEVL